MNNNFQQEGSKILILSRKIGEKIIIGDDVEVVVMDIVGDNVKIGVAAPADVSIDREEVRQRKLNNPHYYDDKRL